MADVVPMSESEMADLRRYLADPKNNSCESHSDETMRRVFATLDGPRTPKPIAQLSDVRDWPDARLLELAEQRASYDAYDVAALAQHVLTVRREVRRQTGGTP